MGKKTAERLALDLADRVPHLEGGVGTLSDAPVGAHDAVQALVSLGMPFSDADHAVRRVLKDDGAQETSDLIRKALALR